jgi:hypothetical protein
VKRFAENRRLDFVRKSQLILFLAQNENKSFKKLVIFGTSGVNSLNTITNNVLQKWQYFKAKPPYFYCLGINFNNIPT